MLSKVVTKNKKPGMFTFTFDDGVSKNFEYLLNILDKHDIKVTFFIVGQTLKSKVNADLVRLAHERGHTIGNHTYSHPYITKISAEDLVLEINKTASLIEAITGEHPRYFRPPYGALTEAIGYKIIDMGYKILLWDIDKQDWNRKISKDELLKSYQDSFPNYNNEKYSYMNLQHDMRRESAEIVPDILKLAKQGGFRIVGVDEFLAG